MTLVAHIDMNKASGVPPHGGPVKADRILTRLSRGQNESLVTLESYGQ
jgi:hypothetical protein